MTLAIGLALRLCLLPFPPSDDMPRYIWEGKITRLGYNPYALPPSSPQLMALRDENWKGINHKDFPSIYPPLAQGVFAALAAVYPSPTFFKAVFVLFDVGAFGLLLLLLRHREDINAVAAIYFLNPLLLLEVALHGHYDSLVLLCLAAFLLALERGKLAWAALFLFFGASVKILALALLPVLVMQKRVRGTLYAAVLTAAVAALLKFSGASDALGRFAVDFQYNSALPFVLHLLLGNLLPRAGERWLAFALLGAAGVTAALRLRGTPPERHALVFLGLLLVFSPTLHPWYLLWILPFAALRRNRPWLLLTGTVAVTYAVYAQAAATGHWREIPWLRLPEYLPPLALWLISLRRPTPV
jgi:hypothetical protein